MRVAIVVPCFNEAGRWNATYWADAFTRTDVEFLFVDDGSTDDTRLLTEQAVAGTNSRVLALDHNGGKAEAVRQGMLTLLMDPEIDAVGYLDADGAFNIDDIVDMTGVYRSRVHDGPFQAVWSSRVALAGRDIDRSDSRHYIGRIIATFISLGYGQIPYDTQSGFKIFRSTADLSQCLGEPFRTRWLFEIELLARWQRQTGVPLRIWEEPLNYWHDVPGSKIKGAEISRVMRELLIVKSEQRRGRA